MQPTEESETDQSQAGGIQLCHSNDDSSSADINIAILDQLKRLNQNFAVTWSLVLLASVIQGSVVKSTSTISQAPAWLEITLM